MFSDPSGSRRFQLVLGFGECELVLSAASVFLGLCVWRRESITPFMIVPLRPYTSPMVAFPGPVGGTW